MIYNHEIRRRSQLFISFLWAKRINANQIHSAIHPVHGNKCFAKPTVQV